MALQFMTKKLRHFLDISTCLRSIKTAIFCLDWVVVNLMSLVGPFHFVFSS